MDRKINILIVEDEYSVIEAVKAYLEREGYVVSYALMGSVALNIIKTTPIDLIILDLMLPDISGEEICRHVRKTDKTPIIMLTAKSSEDSKISGFNLGADDYLIKPFSPRELVARVKALLRRSGAGTDNNIINFEGGLSIDYGSPKVYVNKEELQLTPNEFKLLSFLSQNVGRYYSREALIEHALDNNFDGYDRAIDSHIKNIRQKIEENPKSPKYIITQYGFGYKFDGVKI